MIILGLDPGGSYTGYGVIEVSEYSEPKHIAHGVITLTKKKSLSSKLLKLSEELGQLMSMYSPSEVAIERIFLGKNADSAFKLGHVRGVCMMEAERIGASISEYAPKKIKKIVTGSGSADKEQVRWMVLHLLNQQSVEKDDATDALAIAVCHSRQRQAAATLRKLNK